MDPSVSTPNCRSGLFLVINHDSLVDTGLSKWTGLRVPPLALFVLESGDDNDGTGGTDGMIQLELDIAICLFVMVQSTVGGSPGADQVILSLVLLLSI